MFGGFGFRVSVSSLASERLSVERGRSGPLGTSISKPSAQARPKPLNPNNKLPDPSLALLSADVRICDFGVEAAQVPDLCFLVLGLSLSSARRGIPPDPPASQQSIARTGALSAPNGRLQA